MLSLAKKYDLCILSKDFNERMLSRHGHYSVTDTTSSFKVLFLQNENSSDINVFIEKPLKGFSKLGRHALSRMPQCKDVGLRKTASRTLQISVALKRYKKNLILVYQLCVSSFCFSNRIQKLCFLQKHLIFIHLFVFYYINHPINRVK